jgi:hypothetical protein
MCSRSGRGCRSSERDASTASKSTTFPGGDTSSARGQVDQPLVVDRGARCASRRGCDGVESRRTPSNRSRCRGSPEPEESDDRIKKAATNAGSTAVPAV